MSGVSDHHLQRSLHDKGAYFLKCLFFFICSFAWKHFSSTLIWIYINIQASLFPVVTVLSYISRSLYTRAHFPLSINTCALTGTCATRPSACQTVLQGWTLISPTRWPSAATVACAPWTHPTVRLKACSLTFAWLRERISLSTSPF